MDYNKLREHVDGRFDKLEVKLDNHLERLAVVETEVAHMKGHARLLITAVLSAIGAVVASIFGK